MKTTFDEIIEKVLEHEGGYVNDPDDAGGETKYGIAKRWYPSVDIKNLTKEQAKKIYHTDYWRRGKCDEVPPQLRHIYFDMCVNFGRSVAFNVIGPIPPSTSILFLFLELAACCKTLTAPRLPKLTHISKYICLNWEGSSSHLPRLQ